MRRHWRFLGYFLSFAALAATGCSSDSGPTSPSPTTPPATVGPAGAAFTVDGADGSALSISVPPGALLTDVPIEIAARDTGGFVLRPAGLRFLAPISFELRAPDGTDPAGLAPVLTLTDMRIDLAYERVGNTIAIEMRSLGFAEPSMAKAGATLLRVEDAFLNLEAIDCQLALTNLHARLDMAKQFAFSMESVELLVEQYQAAQQCLLDIDPGAFTLVEAAIQTEACEQNVNALVDLQLDLQFVDELGTLRERVSPVLGSEAALVATAADCFTAGQAIPEIEDAYEVFEEKFRERVQQPDFLAGPGAWSTKWTTEMGAAIELLADLWALGLDDVAATTQEHLLPAMLDQFRVAARRACEEDGTQQYLADVRTAGHLYGHPISGAPEPPLWANFSAADIARDIQYCGTDVELRVYADALGTPISEEWVQLGAATAASIVDAATITVPSDGFLEFEGLVPALVCYGGTGTTTLATDKLQIRANGLLLGTLEPVSANLLPTVLDLSVAQLLDLLGLEGDPDPAFTLRIVREGTGCGDLYGPAPFTLFEIEVEVVDCKKTPSKQCVEQLVVVHHEISYRADLYAQVASAGAGFQTYDVEFREDDEGIDSFHLDFERDETLQSDDARRRVAVTLDQSQSLGETEGVFGNWSVNIDLSVTAESEGGDGSWSGVDAYATLNGVLELDNPGPATALSLSLVVDGDESLGERAELYRDFLLVVRRAGPEPHVYTGSASAGIEIPAGALEVELSYELQLQLQVDVEDDGGLGTGSAEATVSINVSALQ